MSAPAADPKPAPAADSKPESSAAADAPPKLSKAEQRRRRKAAQKAERMAKKAAARAEREKKLAEQRAAKKAQEAVFVDKDPVDPRAYFQNRQKTLDRLRDEESFEAYPHKFQTDCTIPEFISKFSGLEQSQSDTESVASLAGRILRKHPVGSKLLFLDLYGQDGKLQLFCNSRQYESPEAFTKIFSLLRRGDIIGVTGYPARTRTGELSIVPRKVVLLSPCLHMLPPLDGLTDVEIRFRQRYLDLIVNRRKAEIFKIRAQAISYVRRFFDTRGFLEVETPMMNSIPGGATAKPFETFHNALNSTLWMRVAPELFLKKLVVGGLERVYEIGKQFRNEGIDLTHNPEFTSCEFYAAYLDYNDVMSLTEELLSGLVKTIKGSYHIQIDDEKNPGKKIDLDFTPPFRRISMIPELERLLKVKFPSDLDSDDARDFLVDLCAKNDVECTPPITTARLIDKLVGDFIEPQCVSPAFICDHPQVMSPLAKWHRSRPGLTERFELFVNGREVCNAYTELNDPRVQLERFRAQEKDRKAGDDEAQRLDQDFITSLEYGLPPTGGWGMGIDRLVMLLTNSNNIKEVLLFPAMKPERDDASASSSSSTPADAAKAKAKASSGDTDQKDE